MPSQTMTIKGFLAAIAFIVALFVFAFSLWAEWGPYSWAAAIQIAIMDEYEVTITLLLMFLMFLPLAFVLLPHITASGLSAQVLAFGVPALFVLVHIAATVYFLFTDDTPADSSTFASALRGATFLPHSFVLQRRELPAMDFDHASGVETSRSSSGSSDRGDMFIPFVDTIWPDPRTPVVFKSDSVRLEFLSKEESLEGTIRKAPLPYLVRRTLTDNHSTFAIIVENQGSVRMFWLMPAILYGLALIFGAKSMLKSRRTQVKQ